MNMFFLRRSLFSTYNSSLFSNKFFQLFDNRVCKIPILAYFRIIVRFRAKLDGSYHWLENGLGQYFTLLGKSVKTLLVRIRQVLSKCDIYNLHM